MVIISRVTRYYCNDYEDLFMNLCFPTLMYFYANFSAKFSIKLSGRWTHFLKQVVIILN